MDEFWQQLIAGAPNLVVALYVIWRDGKRVDALLEQQERLIEAFLRKLSDNTATGQEETH